LNEKRKLNRGLPWVGGRRRKVTTTRLLPATKVTLLIQKPDSGAWFKASHSNKKYRFAALLADLDIVWGNSNKYPRTQQKLPFMADES
jgi:hypothetical protein